MVMQQLVVEIEVETIKTEGNPVSFVRMHSFFVQETLKTNFIGQFWKTYFPEQLNCYMIYKQFFKTGKQLCRTIMQVQPNNVFF